MLIQLPQICQSPLSTMGEGALAQYHRQVSEWRHLADRAAITAESAKMPGQADILHGLAHIETCRRRNGIGLTLV